MFDRLPMSSSELTERKGVVRHPVLLTGGANVRKPPPTSSLFADKERVGRLLHGMAARDPRFDPYASDAVAFTQADRGHDH
jgi:hypothetical protein